MCIYIFFSSSSWVYWPFTIQLLFFAIIIISCGRSGKKVENNKNNPCMHNFPVFIILRNTFCVAWNSGFRTKDKPRTTTKEIDRKVANHTNLVVALNFVHIVIPKKARMNENEQVVVCLHFLCVEYIFRQQYKFAFFKKR